MSTRLDQDCLVFGYLRGHHPDLAQDIITLIRMFYNCPFDHIANIQYGHDYQFKCIKNVKSIPCSLDITMTMKPRKLSEVLIYYELTCKASAKPNRNGTVSVPLHHFLRARLSEIDRSSKKFSLYITILKEKYRLSSKAKVTQNVSMNYSDNFEWTLNAKRIDKYNQICSPTFGRSRNWFLSLETNGTSTQLILHILLLPTRAPNSHHNMHSVRSVSVNCNVNIIGLEQEFHSSICSIFGYGDTAELWKHNKAAKYFQNLRFRIILYISESNPRFQNYTTLPISIKY